MAFRIYSGYAGNTSVLLESNNVCMVDVGFLSFHAYTEDAGSDPD